MSDPKPSEAPELTAKTQKLPAITPVPQEDSEEFLAQQELWRYVVWRDYEKQGESVRCQELFSCTARVAISAVKNSLESPCRTQ